MFNTLLDKFLPPAIEKNSPDGFKLQAIILISLFVGNSGFPFMVLFFLIKQPRVGFVVLWSWVIFMCIPFLARKGVQVGKLAHILAGNYFQCHLFLCLFWGGVDAPNMMWFTAIPIVSVLVGGIQHGIIWSSITSLSILGLYGLDIFNLMEFKTTLTPKQHFLILATGSVGLLGAILGSTASFEFLREDALDQRDLVEEALKQEYKRSENLLLNILPDSVAFRLKNQQGTIADDYDDASILFADLVGFTTLASSISAKETVRFLNDIFSRFDTIVDKYELEKIKTIGDAYMIAGGIPIASEDHLSNLLRMSMEMLEVMDKYNAEQDCSLQLRIGIATGPLTAGVIGQKKFSYDVWGNTVNVASRMESTGIPGRVQVTEYVAKIMDVEFDFEKRGNIDIKGKGVMTTYLLVA